MPMIDVYATAGTFADKHQLATDLAAAVMAVEQVPDIPMFRQNTAAFIHELPAGDLSNVDGDTGYVRIQVLTNAGALDRDKQLAVVSRLTAIVAEAPKLLITASIDKSRIPSCPASPTSSPPVIPGQISSPSKSLIARPASAAARRTALAASRRGVEP